RVRGYFPIPIPDRCAMKASWCSPHLADGVADEALVASCQLARPRAQVSSDTDSVGANPVSRHLPSWTFQAVARQARASQRWTSLRYLCQHEDETVARPIDHQRRVLYTRALIPLRGADRSTARQQKTAERLRRSKPACASTRLADGDGALDVGRGGGVLRRCRIVGGCRRALMPGLLHPALVVGEQHHRQDGASG